MGWLASIVLIAASEMLHEMLATVAERRSLTRIVLHLLVQPHLLSFNLACGAGDVYYAVRFLQERCQVNAHFGEPVQLNGFC